MLMPDLEMGYANQEEAIPALSGPAAYQTGTFCRAGHPIFARAACYHTGTYMLGRFHAAEYPSCS